MRTIIKSSCAISPQNTYGDNKFPADFNDLVSRRLVCIEPDYRNIINPLLLRRMPRILKMGLASSQLCINRAGGINPDGITVGTGLGCLDNLEKFLLEVLDNNEHVTSVLPFINSTHNAVAAQVSMLLKNNNYNVTYCHRGFSFESALQDAMMLIEEKQAMNVLVGGIDECTNDFILLHSYLQKWKDNSSDVNLLSSQSIGTIAGEGSSFFMLSAEPDNNKEAVSVDSVHTFYTPDLCKSEIVSSEIENFFNSLGIKIDDIDSVLLGLNGDIRYDDIYHSLMSSYFEGKNTLYYKHLCGEYYTSTAFALWLGQVVMINNSIPKSVVISNGKMSSVKKMLIYNHNNKIEHSLILLSYGRL